MWANRLYPIIILRSKMFMDLDIENLKQEIRKLLTIKAFRLWHNIEWNNEEVGNSEIGFMDLDPGIRPEKIARFINNRAIQRIK